MKHEQKIVLVEVYLEDRADTAYGKDEIAENTGVGPKYVKKILKGLRKQGKVVTIEVNDKTFYVWRTKKVVKLLTGKDTIDNDKLIRTKTGILKARHITNDEWFEKLRQ